MGDALEVPRPLRDGGLRPRRECRARRLDRAVHVPCRAFGYAAHDRFGGRIDDRCGLGRGGGYPGAVDIEGLSNVHRAFHSSHLIVVRLDARHCDDASLSIVGLVVRGQCRDAKETIGPGWWTLCWRSWCERPGASRL